MQESADRFAMVSGGPKGTLLGTAPTSTTSAAAGSHFVAANLSTMHVVLRGGAAVEIRKTLQVRWEPCTCAAHSVLALSLDQERFVVRWERLVVHWWYDL